MWVIGPCFPLGVLLPDLMSEVFSLQIVVCVLSYAEALYDDIYVWLFVLFVSSI